MSPRRAPAQRGRAPRPAVPLITLFDGLLVEREGRAVVHIDVSHHCLLLHLPGREPLGFGLSTGGLDDASRTAALMVRRAIGRLEPDRGPRESTHQGQLFGCRDAEYDDIDLVAVARDDEAPGVGGRPGHGDGLQRLLRMAMLERAVVVARRREPRIDQVTARVWPLHQTPLVYSTAMLHTPFLVEDVLRFRGAAIAVAMAETLPPPVRAAAGVQALIPLLSRWRALFAKDGLVTRAVHKSLARLDEPDFHDVDARDVWRLREITLVQPLRSPRHLRLLSERQALGGPTAARDLRLLQLADDDAIDEALDEVTTALRLRRVAVRQREHVLCEVLGQAEDRVGDDRLPGAGAVRALVRRRLEAVRAARRRLPRVAGVAPVAVAPPIPLPTDLRVRFLVTEDDFLDEGARMHHCVGTYFASAAAGEGYFFHFEDDSGPATVCVGAAGRIKEAKGVCNARSEGARRAAALLSTWAAPLTLLELGDADAVLWQGDGPALETGERPLRTLRELAQAVAVELEGGRVRDLHVFLDLVRGAAERALRGGAWLYFDGDTGRVRAHRVDDDA